MMTDLQLAASSDKASRSGLFEIWIGLPSLDYRGTTWVLEYACNTSEEAKKALESDCRGQCGDYAFEVRCPAAFRARHLTLAKARREREQQAYRESEEFSEIPF